MGCNRVTRLVCNGQTRIPPAEVRIHAIANTFHTDNEISQWLLALTLWLHYLTNTLLHQCSCRTTQRGSSQHECLVVADRAENGIVQWVPLHVLEIRPTDDDHCDTGHLAWEISLRHIHSYVIPTHTSTMAVCAVNMEAACKRLSYRMS